MAEPVYKSVTDLDLLSGSLDGSETMPIVKAGKTYRRSWANFFGSGWISSLLQSFTVFKAPDSVHADDADTVDGQDTAALHAAENLTGNIHLDRIPAELTGKNAATATKLKNARTIGGVSFDGSANIDLPGVNSPGSQNTTGSSGSCTGNAASATNAGYATNAGHANTADSATNAGYATSAGSAGSASTAGYATNAGNAANATVFHGSGENCVKYSELYQAIIASGVFSADNVSTLITGAIRASGTGTVYSLSSMYRDQGGASIKVRCLNMSTGAYVLIGLTGVLNDAITTNASW